MWWQIARGRIGTSHQELLIVICWIEQANLCNDGSFRGHQLQ